MNFRRHVPAFLGIAVVLMAESGCMPPEQDRQALQQGYTDLNAHNLDGAERAANDYIQKNSGAPNIDEAYYLRGLVRLARNEKAEAIADLQMALQKTQRPDLRAKAWRALGDIAYDQNQFKEALDDYQKSLAIVSDGSSVHVNYRIGEAMQALGNWSGAEPYFQRVITLGTDPALTKRSVARMDARNFSLQFMALTDPHKAAEEKNQLLAAGVPAIVASTMRDNQLVFLVLSGNYPTWQAADIARTHYQPTHPLVMIVP